MFKFFSHIKNIIEFTQLEKKQKRIVFYSEGKNYWVHLEGLLKETLNNSDTKICYVSSNDNDPGLKISHPNLNTFKIDDGFIRNWFFENIDADLMVMTMPDLDQYQVKRSKFNVHYVYVQHSLVSFHMVYRTGAFDHYNTIFCAGPHHLKEIRALESQRNLPKKHLVQHGYARLDSILSEASNRQCAKKKNNETKHVLIAPSWGKNGTIESGIGKKIVGNLLEKGYKVTLRPHPQTILFFKKQVDEILNKYYNSPLFFYEANVAGQDSLHQSDIMISDWSGAALDYAFGLNKPVLFIDVPRKINNDSYHELNISPIEVEIRTQIGDVIELKNIAQCSDYIKRLLYNTVQIKTSEHVFNAGKSDKVGCKALMDLLNEI